LKVGKDSWSYKSLELQTATTDKTAATSAATITTNNYQGRRRVLLASGRTSRDGGR
jgi:hypothetical protein